MGETGVKRTSIGTHNQMRNGRRKAFDPSVLAQIPNRLQNCLKSQLRKLAKSKAGATSGRSEGGSLGAIKVDLDGQLQTWRENPSWVDQPPEIKVSVPNGSLCKLDVKVNVGLPPDVVYNIVTDPDSRKVFKNIKEVISREVVLDEGHRQVVELEQAAIWKFLWWSGTISVHVLVDQNRRNLSMNFKQVKTGLMKQFEGYWRVEPVFVDEDMCYPLKPKTGAEYCQCTRGKGRVASKVTLEQIIQPAIVPPPPISWYLRGITAKTTEMIANDLLVEAARIRRGDSNNAELTDSETCQNKTIDELGNAKSSDIKERWALHRGNAKRHRRRLSPN